jgi:leucyl/phenylalanyl-tRNA--protein transferase
MEPASSSFFTRQHEQRVTQLLLRIGAMPVTASDDDWTSDIGLLGVGGVLEPALLLAAYRLGVFPWPLMGEEGPIFWCSPDPRFVLAPDDLHVPRSLGRALRKNRFEITYDQRFDAVIEACSAVSRPGHQGTWITAEMIEAYRQLHRLGYAHSVECLRDGELVGGLYGVASGSVFFGESMFALESDASKVALVTLVQDLRHRGFRLIDCQQTTEHLARFGAREVGKEVFLRVLDDALTIQAVFPRTPELLE